MGMLITWPAQPSVPRSSDHEPGKIGLNVHSELYHANGQPVQPANKTSCLLPGGITKDTTFTLAASKGTETQYATLTLTVPNPTFTGLTVNGHVLAQDLTVSNSNGQKLTTVGEEGLAVLGHLHAKSDLTAGWSPNTKLTTSQTEGLNVSGNLVVAGPAEFHSTLQVNDSLNAHNGLRVAKEGVGWILHVGHNDTHISISKSLDVMGKIKQHGYDTGAPF
ncbi:hypothetical protein ACPF8X_18125 [Streptomyces sp. G35A]